MCRFSGSFVSDSFDPMDCCPPGFSWPSDFPGENWCGFPFSPPGDLPNPGIELESPAGPTLAGGFFTPEPPWEPHILTQVRLNSYGKVSSKCPVWSLGTALYSVCDSVWASVPSSMGYPMSHHQPWVRACHVSECPARACSVSVRYLSALQCGHSLLGTLSLPLTSAQAEGQPLVQGSPQIGRAHV